MQTPNSLTTQQVQLSQFPDVVHKRRPGENQITVGDLHGNALKLMFILISEGIVTNMTSQQYQELVRIYSTPTEALNPNHLQGLNAIVSSLEFNKDCLLRLLGDEFSDRGSNDYFTLKILEKLKQEQVPFEIIVSNHGVEFLLAFEKVPQFQDYKSKVRPATSMHNLQALMKKGMVTSEEMVAFAEQSYRPSLKLISYSLSKYKDDSEITIYSHGKTGLDTIKDLTEQLGVKYEDKTAIELAQTIDGINQKFQEFVQLGEVGQLNIEGTAFHNTLWERDYRVIALPIAKNGVHYFFVHGHDKSGSPLSHVASLDNELGKESETINGLEKNPVLYSVGIPIEILIQLEQLKAKQVSLGKDSFLQATERAKELLNLYQDIDTQLKDLCRRRGTADAIMENCTALIEKAKPSLVTPRFWSPGIFSKPQYPTQSAQIIANLEQAIGELVYKEKHSLEPAKQEPDCSGSAAKP
ncbi:MAG: hypothetical protein EBY16_01630 [Gammaproteobacteria bacterium]|nr:hypothetical protein [Gammaproteobacteria bacterium]